MTYKCFISSTSSKVFYANSGQDMKRNDWVINNQRPGSAAAAVAGTMMAYSNNLDPSGSPWDWLLLTGAESDKNYKIIWVMDTK